MNFEKGKGSDLVKLCKLLMDPKFVAGNPSSTLCLYTQAGRLLCLPARPRAASGRPRTVFGISEYDCLTQPQ